MPATTPDLHRYCSRVAQTATDFADASHSKSAKSVTTTVSYGIFSSENAYPCTVTTWYHGSWVRRKLDSKNRKGGIDMTKEQRTLEIIDRLKKEYPLADCTLDYDDAWKLLVSVRLAAQCTDARVNVVVQDLYAKYPDVAALAAAEPEDIEAIVRPCGLGKSKARDICACMRILHEQYHDKVPEDFNALLKLPGVGRKSANLIMGDVFGKPAIVTDTHCIRLSNRIGLVHDTKDPKKVEMALWKIIPPEEGNDLCHRLVNHGREVCTARTKPYCDRCCLSYICEKNGI
mgnify:CR=1 FL=1